MKDTFAILGAGRLGRTLGRLLERRGLRPGGISCRTLRSARLAVSFIGGGRPTTSNVRAVEGSGLVLISTPDRLIASVARELAESRLSWTGRVVAHTSGAISSAALEPIRRRGARVASIHPLASIADPRAAPRRLAGIPCALEGDPAAVRLLRALVVSLGGTPVAIPRQTKALYHLIASLLSNDLVALLSLGIEAASGLGLGPREATRLYLPLVRSTIENVAHLGPVRALTGPISRGDLSTLRLHAEALRALPAGFRRLHRLLALRSIVLALKARTVGPEEAARMARLLGSLP